MDRHDIEFHVARLASGSLPFKHDGRRYFLRRPSHDAVMMAREVREEAAADAERSGLLTADDARRELIRRRIVNPEDEGLIEKIGREIRDAQVRLYEARGNVEDTQIPRQFLAQARAEVARLEGLRDVLYDATPESHAERVARRFLVGCSIRTADDAPYWRDPDVDRLRNSDRIVEAAMARLAAVVLPMAGVREVARSPSWQAVWGLRETAAGVVAQPSSHLGDETASLLQWSIIYDNARRCEKPPEDPVFEDDDMFDGWTVVRGREVEEQEARRRKQSDRGPITRTRDALRGKIENSDEVFVMARRYEYGEEAEGGGVVVREVVDLAGANSEVDAKLTPTGRALRDSRLAYIHSDEAREIASLSKTGSFPEVLFPDRREQLSLDLETVKATWLEEKRLGLRK